jgi:ribosomal protein S18 acetylase RimI-like enzyme
MYVRRATEDDEAWIRTFLDERWGGQEQVENGGAYRPADLPGFLVEEGGETIGYAALRVIGEVAEIGLIEALRPGEGVGSALVGALADESMARGCSVLRATTTNDNVGAQAFYEALGFRLVAERPGAVNASRRVKPQIPSHAADGTPITDELEFELVLDTSSR